jgi:hypothetical protein
MLAGHRLLDALLDHKINEREASGIDRHCNESDLSPDKRLTISDFSAVQAQARLL